MAPTPDMSLRWQDQKVVKKDGQWTVDGRPSVQVSLVGQESPANIPNHYYLGLKVTAPVNAASPPHTHGGGAIFATMIRGTMLNQMVCSPHHDADSQGDGPKIYRAGESWYEPPGCHHVRSENVGDDEAEFVAWFVIDKERVDTQGLASLVVFDAAVAEEKEEQEKRMKAKA